MAEITQYSLQELKLLYRILHAQLPQQPSLIDSELLGDLQAYLQQQASRDGVDVSHHAQWARWLDAEPRLKSL